MRCLPLVLLVLAPALCAQGEQDTSPFSYMYLQGGFHQQQERDTELKSSGYGLSASMAVGDHGFVDVGWSSTRTGQIDAGAVTGRLEFQTISAGVGGHVPLGERADATASVSYILSRMRGLDGFRPDPTERDDGLAAALGVRYLPWRKLEISAGPGYSYVGGTEGWDAAAGLSVEGVPGAWLDLGYWVAEYAEGWSISLRAPLGE